VPWGVRVSDSPNWNAWFSRIRLGLWTDTDYYRALAKGLPVSRPGPRDIAWLPFHGYHHLFAGATGFGKSNDERIVLKELLPGIEDGAVEAIGFDAQYGVELQEAMDAGLLKEFHWGKGVGDKTTEYPDGKPYEATFAEALERHVLIMQERSNWMRLHGVKEWEITKTDPARVILIDEAGQLFRPNISPALRNRIIGAVDTLTFQSRKCGYVVVACTQQTNVDALKIRHGLTMGVCHWMNSIHSYQQVLGGMLGDWPPLLPVKGLAYMKGMGKRILRTQYVPTLGRPREPIIVNSARMPAYQEDPVIAAYEPVPVYQSHVGVVDTFSGEVLDSDDAYGYR
jgi:hypothetical protein